MTENNIWWASPRSWRRSFWPPLLQPEWDDHIEMRRTSWLDPGLCPRSSAWWTSSQWCQGIWGWRRRHQRLQGGGHRWWLGAATSYWGRTLPDSFLVIFWSLFFTVKSFYSALHHMTLFVRKTTGIFFTHFLITKRMSLWENSAGTSLWQSHEREWLIFTTNKTSCSNLNLTLISPP